MRAVIHGSGGEPWTRGAMPLPLWAIALVLAILAPFAAKMLATWFERRSRERSRELLGRGGSPRASDEESRTARSSPRSTIDERPSAD